MEVHCAVIPVDSLISKGSWHRFELQEGLCVRDCITKDGPVLLVVNAFRAKSQGCCRLKSQSGTRWRNTTKFGEEQTTSVVNSR